MKKAGICKLKNLLIVMFLLAVTGCGANSSSVTGSPSGVGNASLAANLQWGTTTSGSGARALAAPAGVAKLRLAVTGSTIPAVKKDFDVSGGATSGQVDGIYAGKNLTLTALALDSTGAVLYEGSAFGIDLASGENKNVGTISMVQPHTRTADAPCLSCHETVSDKFSGRNLIADFKASAHYTNDSSTGCVGCHGANHNDTNPVASGKCFSCHTTLGAKHQNAASIGNDTPARWLNGTNTNCNACHQSHNPIKGIGFQERKDWAASGHGDVNGAAWAHYDFTTRDTCNACHTTTGFLKALDNNWNDTTKLSSTGSGKEVAACNACHASNDFKNGGIRTIAGGYKAGMGGYGAGAKAIMTFADVGESNVCIPCHASRENGDSIRATVTTTGTSSFKNPHYLAAAAVFYGKGGFQFYTSGVRYNTYGAAGKIGRTANWSHGKLGIDNYTTTTSATVKASGVIYDSGNKGQCVSCHLGPKNTHTFGAVETAKATFGTSVNTRGCYGCHTGTDMSMEAFVEEEKEVWDRMFDFLTWQLQQYNIYYNDANNPYFFTAPYVTGGTNTAFTAWNTPVGNNVVNSQKTMGAAMNLKLLKAEKGSFVHNRKFGRALIADSLIYLQNGTEGDRSVISPTQNGVINFTAYSTARPVSYPGQVGANVSITVLKSYLTSAVTGGYVRK
ncbi:cytochrome c3 family protein [Geomonas sp. RF6]|uniref:cytochrome c3 family protein n=1 Tax=Geomonas sp. RF6 TaxID=2897342 RepID=UPI001E59E8BF|nr:cytochrome c3 family protein [Geomonas sp. RF6]UFS71403.1 cytochrome c3 family protein [Geomonas sp. RF6]